MDLKVNHGIALSRAQQAWYVKKADTQLEDMRREYPATPEEAFEASVEGAYYSAPMAKAELEHRIGKFPAEPGFPVHTSWDIGLGDDNAIWAFQIMPSVVRLVGFYSNSGEPLGHYLDKLELMAAENGWRYHTHFVPHDIQVREWTDGKTRIETMLTEVRKRGLGKAVRMVGLHKIEDGIHASRQLLSLCQFDAGPTAEGVKSLKAYRKSWNKQLGCWRDQPRHDQASHGADAFRCLAMSYKDVTIEPVVPASELDPVGNVIPFKPRDWKYLFRNELLGISRRYRD